MRRWQDAAYHGLINVLEDANALQFEVVLVRPKPRPLENLTLRTINSLSSLHHGHTATSSRVRTATPTAVVRYLYNVSA